MKSSARRISVAVSVRSRASRAAAGSAGSAPRRTTRAHDSSVRQLRRRARPARAHPRSRPPRTDPAKSTAGSTPSGDSPEAPAEHCRSPSGPVEGHSRRVPPPAGCPALAGAETRQAPDQQAPAQAGLGRRRAGQRLPGLGAPAGSRQHHRDQQRLPHREPAPGRARRAHRPGRRRGAAVLPPDPRPRWASPRTTSRPPPAPRPPASDAARAPSRSPSGARATCRRTRSSRRCTPAGRRPCTSA